MKSIAEINLNKLTENKTFHPSPDLWEKQVLYFLMLDRFSDGKEKLYKDNEGNTVKDGETPPYNPESDYENDTSDKRDEAGLGWNGGNLKGLSSKLGYLKRMGITTIWISPVLKQIAFEKTYHGYATQNFLEIDPHFGTREDLKNLVAKAHEMGLYVILDIIVNHSGNVFAYRKKAPKWRKIFPYRIKGFRDKEGRPTISASKAGSHSKHWPDGSVWPKELQRPSTYTRRGQIVNWDNYPEYIEGDFYNLKNHYLGKKKGNKFYPSDALKVITEAYKYWIAYADLDGFRLDTVKHMWPGAVKFFTDKIHEFTRRIGKENFYIIGEITGGKDLAMDTIEYTGLNAALGINNIPETLENGVKGYSDLKHYFDLFENDPGQAKENRLWFRNNVVTMFDDHDMVSQGEERKVRFCADHDTAPLVLPAIFTNVFTSGIPCLYYGTEQGFDGNGPHDRHIRENMFGGSFGAFRSTGKHFFREENSLHSEISQMLVIRAREPALQTGTQFYRQISYDGQNFYYPQPENEARYVGVLAWSRFHEGYEVILAINTHTAQAAQASIQIDTNLHEPGDTFECLYRSYEKAPDVEYNAELQGEITALKVELPAAGCAIFKRTTNNQKLSN